MILGLCLRHAVAPSPTRYSGYLEEALISAEIVPRGVIVKIYNVIGYLIILVYMLACMYSAPAHLGPWTGLLIGAIYFIFCWFLGGLYLADLLHLGIAHRSLDYKEWFIKLVTVVNNIFAIYVEPVSW